MPVKVGDRLPDATFNVLQGDQMSKLTTAQVFEGKKVVLFAVPGAFTPGCSKTHCPSFVRDAEKLKSKGVHTVACTAVNDAFVLQAWSKSQNADGKILMLADGNGTFAKTIGMELDASAFGLGTRSKRYAMIVENRIVKHIALEDAPSQIEKTAANAILAKL